MTDLLAIRDGRPSVIVQDGCRIYVAVHDEYYQRMKAEYKNRLKLAHPDMTPVQQFAVAPAAVEPATVKGFATPRTKRTRSFWRRTHTRKAHTRKPYTLHVPNTGTAFRKIRAAYERWLAEEHAWYAAFGLTPPEWSS